MFNMLGVCTYDRVRMKAVREAREKLRQAGGGMEGRLSPRERSRRADVCVGKSDALVNNR